MATATTIEQPRKMTVEEFLALPDDGVERWLIDGELREAGKPIPGRELDMTVRNRTHTMTCALITHALVAWSRSQPTPRAKVHSGEAGVRLREGDSQVVGVDIALISAEQAADQPENSTLIHGAPMLVAEILSPTDTHESVSEKTKRYLNAGVKVVWIVDPMLETVTAYSPGKNPAIYGMGQILTAEPELHDFAVAVEQIFRL